MKLLHYLVSIQARHCIFSVPRTNLCRNFISTITYNECSMVSSLRIFMPRYKRDFMIYALTFNKKSEYSDESKSSKKQSHPVKEGPVVSVINENGVESVMPLADAEKLAKRRNLKLVLHESSTADRVKYKLQKSLELKKEKEKDKKKVVLREETQPHDVEIKINQIMRFLEKGLNVMCIVETSGNKGNEGKVLELLEESKLKSFLISKRAGKRNIQLNYRPVVQAAPKEKKTQKENNENAQVSE